MQVKGGTLGKQTIVFLMAFFGSIAIGMVNLSVVFYAKDVLGLKPAHVGALAAMWCSAYAASCLLSRRLYDRVPPRYPIVGSSAMMGLLVFAMLASDSAAQVFPLYALYGASMALFWSPLMGWLSVGAEGRILNRLSARFNMSWSMGAIASPYATGRLYELRPELPLQIGGGLLLAMALFAGLAALLLPTIRTDRTHRPDRETRDDSTTYRFPSWIGLGATYFGMGVLGTVFPLAARSEAGFSESDVGLSLLVFSLCNFIGFFALGRTVFWHFRTWPVSLALTLRAAAFAALMGAGTMGGTVGLMALFGFTLSMAYSASLFHGASGSVNKTKRMTIHEAVISSSVVMGTLIGGALYQSCSAAKAYLAVAGVSVGAALVCAAFAAKRKRCGVAT